MRKALAVGVVGLGLLAGCASPDLGMKLQKNGQETILMGSVIDAMNAKKASFSATNGDLMCDGTSKSGQTKTLMTKYKVTMLFDVTCSDGTSGSLAFQGTHDGMDSYIGAGTGTLNDGTKVKVVVGDAVLMAL